MRRYRLEASVDPECGAGVFHIAENVVWLNEEKFATRKQDMTRADAIARARQQLHSGEFLAELDRRVAYQTESQNPERRAALRAYLVDELTPAFAQLDFS